MIKYIGDLKINPIWSSNRIATRDWSLCCENDGNNGLSAYVSSQPCTKKIKSLTTHNKANVGLWFTQLSGKQYNSYRLVVKRWFTVFGSGEKRRVLRCVTAGQLTSFSRCSVLLLVPLQPPPFWIRHFGSAPPTAVTRLWACISSNAIFTFLKLNQNIDEAIVCLSYVVYLVAIQKRYFKCILRKSIISPCDSLPVHLYLFYCLSIHTIFVHHTP